MEHTHKDWNKVVEDMGKRLQWAREDADMRKIDLDKVTAHNASLAQGIADLTQMVQALQAECEKWRNLAYRLHNPYTHMDAVREMQEINGNE